MIFLQFLLEESYCYSIIFVKDLIVKVKNGVDS